MSYKYDDEFFDFVDTSAGRSASAFIDVVVKYLFSGVLPQSVIDVGCGRGVWAAEWRRRGVAQCLGVDGEYVPRSSLLIPETSFLPRDLTKAFDLGRRFDLVQCLEVAEHVPSNSATVLIDTLVRHGDVVIFSAAVPGQGGEHHVNERPFKYWRTMFDSRGYRMYDAVRPSLRGKHDIEPWYRYNAFVFASDSGLNRLNPSVPVTCLEEGHPIPQFAPLSWRARCLAISLMPEPIATAAARLKHRLANRFSG
jgi:SAM-dependent methyltransferase